jgi:phosphoribosylformylglycinamidine synthase PurS subunit
VPVHRIAVDIMLKPEILDPAGQAVSNALPTLGFAAAASLRIGKHVELELEADDEAAAVEQARRMAEVLLANPVIEDFRVSLATHG